MPAAVAPVRSPIPAPKDAIPAVPGGHTDEAIGDRTRGGANGPAAGSGGAGACGRKR